MVKAINKATIKEAKQEEGIKVSVKEDISRRAKLHLIMGPVIILIFVALFFACIHKPYKNIQKASPDEVKAKVIGEFSDDVKKNSNRLAINIKSKK